MESVSSTRGLETRRWSMFDREGSSIVNRIDILNLAYRHR